MSLASSAILALRSSDVDIHRAVFLDDVEFLQPNAAVADIHAGLEMKLIGVPRADDVHVVAVVILTQEGAVRRHHIEDLRHSHASADREARMRAMIPVGVMFAPLADGADLDPAGGNDADPTVGHHTNLKNQFFSHS